MDNNDENTPEPERTLEEVFELTVDQAYKIFMKNSGYMLDDLYHAMGNATLKIRPDSDIDELSLRCKTIVEAMVVKYCQ